MRFLAGKLGFALCLLLLPAHLSAHGLDEANADLAPVQMVDPTTGMPIAAADTAHNATDTPSSDVSASTPDAADAASVSSSETTAPGTYSQQDVLSQAEGVFGKGAEGLANLIERLFSENGEPNGYIAGREAGGALAIGLRYGSGTLFHKIEGQRPVYWTGPSVGFDIGADASKTFTLVYNLYDTNDLFARYPQVEGKVYFIGGFSATYLQRDDVILVPIKLGVGWRLGANVGFMNFTKKSRILPF